MDNDFMNLLNSQENPNPSQNFSYYPNNSYFPNDSNSQNNSYFDNDPNSQNNSQFQYTPNYVEQTQIAPSPSTNNNNKEKKKKTKRGESHAWRETEDKALMSAWGIISGDPIRGKNQKDNIRWGKVWELYELSRVENPNEIGIRNTEALRCRFKKLSEHASKWLACLKSVLSRGHKSGTNDAYVESEAQKLYRDENIKNENYGELSVYKSVMSKYRRWNLQQTEVNWNEGSISQSDGSSKRSRMNESDEPNLGTGDETIPETPPSVNVGETIHRPEGREAAKKKRRGKSTCSESSINPQLSTQLNGMQIAREEGNHIMKDRLDFEREKLRLESETEKMKAEMMIVNTLLGRQDLTPSEEHTKNYLMNKYWPN